MITSSDIYWITRLDVFNNVAQFLCFVSLVLFVLGAITWWMYKEDGSDQESINMYAKSCKTLFAAFLVTTLVWSFIPTTKEFAVIYLAPKVINNEQVQKLPDNFVKLLNTKMEQWMKTQTEDKKK